MICLTSAHTHTHTRRTHKSIVGMSSVDNISMLHMVSNTRRTDALHMECNPISKYCYMFSVKCTNGIWNVCARACVCMCVIQRDALANAKPDAGDERVAAQFVRSHCEHKRVLIYVLLALSLRGLAQRNCARVLRKYATMIW